MANILKVRFIPSKNCLPNSKKTLRRRQVAFRHSDSIPRNLARADEVDEWSGRGERARARLRYERALGDPDFHGDVTQGLPLLRAKWIRDRGDVETVAGRPVTPSDDGWLSEAHAAHASAAMEAPNPKIQTPVKLQRSTFKDQGLHCVVLRRAKW